jgi:hypothetical protein
MPAKVSIDDTNDRMHTALVSYLGKYSKLTVKAYGNLARTVQEDRPPRNSPPYKLPKKKFQVPCCQPWLQPPMLPLDLKESFWPQGGRTGYATFQYAWKDCMGFEWFDVWVYGGS